MDTNEWYESIILEIRPFLQSINVFVILKENQEVDVKLKNNSLEFIINQSSYNILLKDIEIVQDSLTNLQLFEKTLSFRIATNNKNQIGTFKRELLQINEDVNTEICKNILKSTSYSIHCSNCLEEFVKLTHFERILPLPSEDCEPQEWFCHSHNSEIRIGPRIKDFLYSNCFFHINETLFTGIAMKGKVLICNNCQEWIGLRLKNNTCKFWYNTVILKSNNEIITSNPLQDVITTIRSMENHFSMSNRYVFLCPLSECKTTYLTLWIIEKSLLLHVYMNNVKQEHKTYKVLFKVHSEKNEEIEEWLSNSNVSTVLVSKNMMDSLIEHLTEMKRNIPSIFNEVNNLSVSYLLIYNK